MSYRFARQARAGFVGMLAATVLMLGGCATPTLDLPTPAALADLAPRSTLRVAFIRSNPLHAVEDRKTGELRGPGIDLARSLANRLGVPLETQRLTRSEDIVASANSGAWDVAFLAVDRARANELDFSRPYLEAQGAREAIALPKGKRAGRAYLNQFVELNTTSGFVQRSIDRAGIKGATVPAGSR